MKYLFAGQALATLIELAHRRALLAFDFDGTLAPLHPDRTRAAMRDDTAALLAHVCDRYPCAVISGRERSDVAARLGGARLRAIVGNHGLEGAMGPAGYARYAQDMRVLKQLLGHLRGVEVEDKQLSLAVHGASLQRVFDLVARINRRRRFRMIAGKRVLNIVPASAPDKGDALDAVMKHTGARAALFIGDDITDEDVFARNNPALLTVRVGYSPRSQAQYFLRTQREIDDVLDLLAQLAGHSPTSKPTARPTSKPTAKPTSKPTSKPSSFGRSR